ncbi:MAG: hypothetical protein ACI30M_07095 [Muribaculaceae bacterium]
MKRIILTIISVLAVLSALAQPYSNHWDENQLNNTNTTPSSGDWTYNHITYRDSWDINSDRRVNAILKGKNTTTGTNVRTVYLNGTIYMRYPVFVGLSTGSNTPTVLEIINNTEQDITIWNDLDNNGYKADWAGTMFSVWEGCTLKIKGNPKGKIIIRGNYNYRPTSAVINYGFIESTGNLELEHVIIENVGFNETNARAGECSVMKIHPWYNLTNGWTYEQGSTKLSHCEIRNITMPGGVGAAMYCYLITQNKDNNTRERCTIELDSVKIHNVHQGSQSNDGNGGLIRFRGDWVGDLKLNRLHIENCSSGASCAGVYWNALGRSSDPCKMYVNNCTFDNCTVTGSDQNGGAMMVEGRCEFIGEGRTTFMNCSTTGVGGGLYIHNYNSTDHPQEGEAFSYNLGTNLLFQKNHADKYGGGAAIIVDNAGNLPNGTQFYFDINGAEFDSNTSGEQGGALKIDYVSSKYGLTLNLNSGTFKGNSSKNGGAIYSYQANVSYSSGLGNDAVCEFYNNTATASGSALYIHDARSFNMKTVKAYQNTCNVNDGVIYLLNSTMTMDNGKIYNNKSAGWGCGIYMRASTLTIQNGEITDNTCNNRGGGIYMYNSTLTIEDGKINYNKALNQFGGGVCARKSNFIMKKGEIIGNYAKTHGGGIYFDNSKESPDDQDCLTARTFKFSGGSISNNQSEGFGGGVCIYTGEPDGSTFEITGGKISNNTAANGGGVYLNAWGKYEIPLHNTDIEHNTAYLGGGVLMYNGTLNYKKGLIRYNKAIARTGNTKPATMYQVNHRDNSPGYDAVRTDLSGIGGGIYSTWGKINFLNTNEGFGIYSNTADFGADDLFANADRTTMDLPTPTDMTVTGFDVPNTSLQWYEDYIEGDSNFDKKPDTAGAGPNKRYRTLLYEHSKDLANAKFQPGTAYSNYIMAALGYNFVQGILKKSGLKKGETTILNIYRGDISTMVGAEPYIQVPLTGDENGNAQRTILLQPGKWTVVESTWSWTYNGKDTGKTVDGQPAITRDLYDTPDENPRTFSFTNEKQKSAPNAESIKKNVFE